MVTSSTCMLTIVTSDRERPRLLWKLTCWRSWAGMLAHDRDIGSWAPQTSWRNEVLKTLDDHELEEHAHDRDMRSWAPQTAYKEWTFELTSWRRLLTIVTSDRERPKVDTIDILGSRCFRSRSWCLCPGRDALYHDRDDGSWQVKLSYFLAFFWCWSLHLMIVILALLKPEIYLMEILV